MRAAAVADTNNEATGHINVSRFRTAQIIVRWDADCDHTSLELRLDITRNDGTTFESVLQMGPVAAGVTPVTPWTGQFTRASWPSGAGGGAVDLTIASSLGLRAQIKRTGGTAVGTVGIYFVGGGRL